MHDRRLIVVGSYQRNESTIPCLDFRDIRVRTRCREEA